MAITTMVDTTITIESPHPGVNRVVNVTAARGATVNLPVSLMLQNSSIERKGVLVRAPVDIAVYVFTENFNKGEAYTAIPASKLGTAYIGAALYNSFIAIVAYKDNTHVNITVGALTQFYNGRVYKAGETIHVYLTKLGTFQIKGDPHSFNTDITSDSPIGVISGAKCYDISGYSDIGNCNHMIEYIPPMKSFGTVFIIPPILRANKTYDASFNRNKSYTVELYGKNYSYSGTWSRANNIRRPANIPYVYKVSNPGLL